MDFLFIFIYFICLNGCNDVCASDASNQNAESLSEIEGDTLQLYGSRSLDAFDRSWGFQAAGCVNTVHFHYVDFDEVVKILAKIRVRFPNVVVSSSISWCL